ncbi:MAG: response regulator [Gemmatimonadaceae bacterium]
MRPRITTVLMAAAAFVGNSLALQAARGQTHSAAEMPAVSLLHRALDSVGARVVRVPGTVESIANVKGIITLKLVNGIPGSDSATLYVIGAAEDAAGLARFNPGDNVTVSSVIQRKSGATAKSATYYALPQSIADVKPIGWTQLGRERLTVGLIAAIALVLLVAIPLRNRDTDDNDLEQPMRLETEASPRSLTPAFARTLRSTARVLLIEDEPLVRLAARRGLERSGFEVEEAATGAEAMALWNASGDSFDCVVSDVILPNGMGPDVVERMRSERHGIPVLFVSGQAKRLNPSVLQEPHTAFLQKPFGSKQLADALSALLNPTPLAA